jgi:transcriptional regulator with GAF, ATPase, and Fis domain
MNGLAARKSSEIHLVNRAGANSGEARTASAQSMTQTLEQLALELLKEAQSLHEVPALDVRTGIDFYEEVRRFEIDLIQRTLVFTFGSQVRAAQLLKMKVTTLNSKIKHYGIDINALVRGLMSLEAAEAVQDRA